MKQLILLFSVLISGTAFGTTLTVSNYPATVAQYSTIQAAVDASASGDTIYVHGSPYSYSGFTITNKRIVVIGPGWSPDKALPYTTIISSVVTIGGTGSTGTEFQGLIFTSSVNIITATLNNIRFIRNKIERTQFNFSPSTFGNFSGYVFEGNWFDNVKFSTAVTNSFTNFLFQNNIFYSSNIQNADFEGFNNTTNFLIDHNLFYATNVGANLIFSNGCRFITLANNIFVRKNAANNLFSSVFHNNITYLTANDLPWTVNSNSDAGGNIGGQDPQMAAQSSVNTGVNNPLLDFSISAGTANNGGSDGKDIGLLYDLSGSLNWVNSRMSRLPFIFSMNITTPTVVPGGSINVQIESRRNN